MRRALDKVLPRDVLERRKSPYPKTHNPVYLEAVKERLLQVLDDRASPLVPLLNKNAIIETARTHGKSFSPAWFSQLMGGAQLFAYLLQVDTWLRK